MFEAMLIKKEGMMGKKNKEGNSQYVYLEGFWLNCSGVEKTMQSEATSLFLNIMPYKKDYLTHILTYKIRQILFTEL